MTFIIHPNQYLPETGYLTLGDTVVMTKTKAESLMKSSWDIYVKDYEFTFQAFNYRSNVQVEIRASNQTEVNNDLWSTFGLETRLFYLGPERKCRRRSFSRVSMRCARKWRGRDLDALVIYGDNYSFADLCYLTNYFPKVRGGIAVVPREGAISMLLNIGSRDVPFAKTLTWVEDVRASNQVGADGAKLFKEKGFEKAKIGLMDSGQGFPLPQLEDMKSALPQRELARLAMR